MYVFRYNLGVLMGSSTRYELQYIKMNYGLWKQGPIKQNKKVLDVRCHNARLW